MLYRNFFSKRSLCRTPSPIRALFPLSQLPGMLNLAGGLPHPESFPITGISITLRDGKVLTISDEEVKAALQYCPSYGLSCLLEELLKFMQQRHSLQTRSDLKICVGTGSQDVLAKAFDMLLDEGDPILVEEACYPGVLSALQIYSPTLLPVEADDQGMIPEKLSLSLQNWKGKKPKVLYLCPTGQNPTGTTMPTHRKVEIYRICQEHNLILLEDDPYYHLYFGDETERKSFLSLDTDGRVLRFDSFSKIFSAGMRIGWVTGNVELVERIQLDMQTQALNVSGVSQVLTANILRHLQSDGFELHMKKVVEMYKNRRDVLVKACAQHLGDLATYHVPNAGMFLWLKLKTVKDSDTLVMVRAQQEKVLFVPGKAFSTSKKIPSPFLRASYSTVNAQDMDEAIQRLRRVLDAEQKK